MKNIQDIDPKEIARMRKKFEISMKKVDKCLSILLNDYQGQPSNDDNLKDILLRLAFLFQGIINSCKFNKEASKEFTDMLFKTTKDLFEQINTAYVNREEQTYFHA